MSEDVASRVKYPTHTGPCLVVECKTGLLLRYSNKTSNCDEILFGVSKQMEEL